MTYITEEEELAIRAEEECFLKDMDTYWYPIIKDMAWCETLEEMERRKRAAKKSQSYWKFYEMLK